MKFTNLIVLTIALGLSQAARAATFSNCETILSDETLEAASYIIDYGDDGSMGDVVGDEKKPKKTEEPVKQPEIRKPELELPLEIVPPSKKRDTILPPPPVPVKLPIPKPKQPDKFRIN